MYKLYVNSMSPFSSKASALLGYAGMPVRLETQNLVTRFAVLKRMTGKTMVPTLRRGGWAINDSTHIAEYAIERVDTPLLPRDPDVEPLCWLLEDFADEWLSRWMLFSRWYHGRDRSELSRDIGGELTGGVPCAGSVVGRLVGRAITRQIQAGGMSDENIEALEGSRERFLQALEEVFEGDGPRFLFEGYPTVADFAFFGQLHQYERDPTGHDRMRLFPNVREYLGWMERMTLPHPVVARGPQSSRELDDLGPLFAELVGTYWQLLLANHRARARDNKEAYARLLDGTRFSFRTSGYLLGRLEFVLEQVDDAYRRREELFGGQGRTIEHALITQIAHLTEYAEGRQLLRQYPHIGQK